MPEGQVRVALVRGRGPGGPRRASAARRPRAAQRPRPARCRPAAPSGSSERTSSTTAVATRRARGSSVSIAMSSTQGVVQAGITARASSPALAWEEPTRQTRQAPNGLLALVEAERRHPLARGLGGFEHRRAGRDLDLDSVDADLTTHASPSSSGKCLSRLRIGAGMPPPWAQRLPTSSASSSSSSRVAVDRLVRGEHLVRAREPDPAGEALAAALVGAEMQQVAGDVAHVGPVVEGEDPAVAEHAALVRQRLEVERRVEPAGRQDPAERAADLQRLDRAPVTEPAGELLAQLARPASRTAPRRRPGGRSAR